MNREVHYIFSIQTQDYLKSAWARGRRVYLMISPIAQCWQTPVEISGKLLREETEQRRAVSANLQDTKGSIKRKARNDNLETGPRPSQNTDIISSLSPYDTLF